MMKVILVQSSNYKFYYGRYAKDVQIGEHYTDIDGDKDPVHEMHLEIPMYIVQPYHNKGPKEDRSIESVWELEGNLGKNQLFSLQSQAYGSKQLVTAMLVSMGFIEVESKEEKKVVQVYQPGQEKLAYDESNAVDKVLKGNLL